MPFTKGQGEVFLPGKPGPGRLVVTQDSLEEPQLLALLAKFHGEYEKVGERVKYVTQIVEGSMVSLTITPTKASSD
jgi:hypothetical protein